VSSQDDAQARQESGGGLAFPSLAPPPVEQPSSKASPQPKHAVEPAVPVRLVIPVINVDAPVLAGGTRADGSQEVPESFTATSWWKDGQLPGQSGNAVFTGHTYSKGDGVFDRLPELKEGNRIVVRTKKREQTYVVSSVGSVPLDQYSSVSTKIYRDSGRSGIVLQTCGDFDGMKYNATTVVYAVLE
jgi:LPXTG-site transpeptidase (sortase) family protein